MIECKEAVESYQKGDHVEVDAINGNIVVGEKSFTIPKLPKEMMDIMNAGGLLNYTRKKLKK